MKEVLFKERPALMDPPALAHGIPPSSSLKRAKSALLRSRVFSSADCCFHSSWATPRKAFSLLNRGGRGIQMPSSEHNKIIRGVTRLLPLFIVCINLDSVMKKIPFPCSVTGFLKLSACPGWKQNFSKTLLERLQELFLSQLIVIKHLVRRFSLKHHELATTSFN